MVSNEIVVLIDCSQPLYFLRGCKQSIVLIPDVMVTHLKSAFIVYIYIYIYPNAFYNST